MHEHHIDTYYKPKYLKSVADGEHVLAYPDGIPGGWCKHRKIHFVGHSQGAQTVRYLQYLLQIDYFKGTNEECDKCMKVHLEGKTDKSDWIASLTSLNGLLNGNLGSYAFGFCEKIHSYSKERTFSRIVPELAKYLMLIQNLVVPR